MTPRLVELIGCDSCPESSLPADHYFCNKHLREHDAEVRLQILEKVDRLLCQDVVLDVIEGESALELCNRVGLANLEKIRALKEGAATQRGR